LTIFKFRVRSVKTDWEIELGVVIGRAARYIDSDEEAEKCIAGYCISHDVSERSFQLEMSGHWCKGKSCDTFCPLGPFLATVSEVPRPDQLRLRLSVNRQMRQDGWTGDLIFEPRWLIRYISQFMTLEPGDVVSTGTPGGVGLGMKPPQYLAPGDIVELTIDLLGRQRQTCVQVD
jgi:2,4-didehydro-3-deoxy-L-rhamnonate hydrolase